METKEPYTMNKKGLKPGDDVIVDKDFRGGYPASIISINRIFALIKTTDEVTGATSEHNIMINRLTPINEIN